MVNLLWNTTAISSSLYHSTDRNVASETDKSYFIFPVPMWQDQPINSWFHKVPQMKNTSDRGRWVLPFWRTVSSSPWQVVWCLCWSWFWGSLHYHYLLLHYCLYHSDPLQHLLTRVENTGVQVCKCINWIFPLASLWKLEIVAKYVHCKYSTSTTNKSPSRCGFLSDISFY